VPGTTLIIVFGSWIVIFVLTLLYYFIWSRGHAWGEEDGEE
jgi:hypothetical protein